MKKLLLLTFASFLIIGLKAQDVKLKEGNVDFLKGTKNLVVKFTYDPNMKIGKMTEKDYIDKKVNDLNKKEAGTGDEWKEKYYSDRTTLFEPKFMGYFNQHVSPVGVVIEKASATAEYVMIVNTIFIEPGFNIGYMDKPAYVNYEISFVPVNDESKVLAKYTLLKSPGGIYGIEFDFGTRIGEAYAIAGQVFALTLLSDDAF